MRNTSAPARNSRSTIVRLEEAGPSVATTFVRRCRLIGFDFRAWPRAGRVGRRRAPRRPRAPLAPARAHCRREAAGAVIASRQTIGAAANDEFLVAGAHEGLAHPLAAVVVINSVDIIISCDEIALEDGFAGAGGQIPPTLRGPAIGILVADRDPHTACGIVAKTEIG